MRGREGSAEWNGTGLIVNVGEGVGRDSSGVWTADGQDSDGDGEVGRYVGMFFYFDGSCGFLFEMFLCIRKKRVEKPGCIGIDKCLLNR